MSIFCAIHDIISAFVTKSAREILEKYGKRSSFKDAGKNLGIRYKRYLPVTDAWQNSIIPAL